MFVYIQMSTLHLLSFSLIVPNGGGLWVNLNKERFFERQTARPSASDKPVNSFSNEGQQKLVENA